MPGYIAKASGIVVGPSRTGFRMPGQSCSRLAGDSSPSSTALLNRTNLPQSPVFTWQTHEKGF